MTAWRRHTRPRGGLPGVPYGWSTWHTWYNRLTGLPLAGLANVTVVEAH